MSGRIADKNMRLALGIPRTRHSETDGARTSHSRATAVVPPSASISSESVNAFMAGKLRPAYRPRQVRLTDHLLGCPI